MPPSLFIPSLPPSLTWLIAPTTFKSKSLEAKVRQAIIVRAMPKNGHMEEGRRAGKI